MDELETPENRSTGLEPNKSSDLTNSVSDSGQSQPKSILEESEPKKIEVSAATVGMMLGLATARDVELLQGKIDLLTNKINQFAARLEKLTSAVGGAASGSDMERIDVQIGALRTLIKEIYLKEVKGKDSSTSQSTESQETAGQDKLTAMRSKIRTNSPGA